jgi:hypothetical protein
VIVSFELEYQEQSKSRGGRQANKLGPADGMTPLKVAWQSGEV